MGVLIANVGNTQLTVITDPDAGLEAGQPVQVGLRTDRVFYFHAENGENLHSV